MSSPYLTSIWDIQVTCQHYCTYCHTKWSHETDDGTCAATYNKLCPHCTQVRGDEHD